MHGLGLGWRQLGLDHPKWQLKPATDLRLRKSLEVKSAKPGVAQEWRWQPYVMIALVAVCIFAIRLAAPPNLLDKDQERPAAYVLDVLKNGHWLCQTDLYGDITSKPPLYTWLCALAALPFGRINLFALYLPGALAALGVAWLVFRIGREHFGTRAALFGALATMLTSSGFKEFGLARTDGVFAFTVTVAALLAYRSWISGRGWTWFWLAATAATLTKGPLGVVLASTGLVATWWERRSGQPCRVRGSHFAGIALFLAIAGGWFLLAYLQVGPALVKKMLGQELLGHAVSGGKDFWPGMLFYQQPLYYLGRAAPWSLLAFWGFWRIWKQPAEEASARRFERFLFCWFGLGLLLFSLAPHQRADLLWPIMPAGALIAGRELTRLTQNVRTRTLCFAAGFLVVATLAGFGLCYFTNAKKPIFRQTVALKELAHEIEKRGGREFPLTYVDAPITLQFYLNTFSPTVTPERAAQLLRGPEPAYVAVANVSQLRMLRTDQEPPIYVLISKDATCPAQVVSNRPELARTKDYACCFGPIVIKARSAELLQASQDEFRFAASDEPGEVQIRNDWGPARRIRVCSIREGRQRWQERTLASGELWRIAIE